MFIKKLDEIVGVGTTDVGHSSYKEYFSLLMIMGNS